ncbi:MULTISPECIES: VC0807 family protein [unclassified Crossiella]|uniref:VC0807 family protein n=1 Tax=unclassified Crossiella TaxID=2620835 RepID=UPI001FFF8B5A|nr:MULTISPECIES: VC0807 family protein [unclassified Crossiella]MCK2244543.1 hypothetical protein [Crossiella sp. S99.2]MCK2258174.1 hypothetical protein [Crossiella sp. S99.1]
MTRHRLTWLLGLVLDLGLSPLTFYTGRLLGFDNLVCLLAGATAVTLRAGYLLGVRRRIDLLVGLMLATSLLGLAVALLTSDPRLVLLRDPLTSALIALVFLATCLTTRPALFHLAKRLRDNGTEDWDRRISTEPGFRRLFLMLTAVWGRWAARHRGAAGGADLPAAGGGDGGAEPGDRTGHDRVVAGLDGVVPSPAAANPSTVD